jgi:hypothetical protein
VREMTRGLLFDGGGESDAMGVAVGAQASSEVHRIGASGEVNR